MRSTDDSSASAMSSTEACTKAAFCNDHRFQHREQVGDARVKNLTETRKSAL